MAFSLLIVDDSPAMRGFIRRVVELSGFDAGCCLEAGDGAEALDVLKAQWVDVVITDINMPRMNGEEFLRHMEADELLREVPVVVVSTDATRSRRERMLGLGARAYVPKPFQPECLRDALETVLEARNAA